MSTSSEKRSMTLEGEVPRLKSGPGSIGLGKILERSADPEIFFNDRGRT